MKKSILLTSLLSLMLSTLTFAQDTPTPKKERNWTVGVGGNFNMNNPEGSYSIHPLKKYVLSVTVGYKGFTVSGIQMWDKRNFYPYRNLTIGYQHTFMRKSDAVLKPIVGLEAGPELSAINVGMRYKRSQFLLSTYYRGGRDMAIPFIHNYIGGTFATLKYQFLF
tara:strand:- start:1200 stop:1694 length:495 start_codon:yes stop_codon:yes gene_type:complete